jgi:hypothetical protein
MALPNGGKSSEIGKLRQLNVVLFDNYPEAVLANVEIVVEWAENYYGFTPDGVFYQYSLTAQREQDGYFHFVHTIIGSDYIDNDNLAMNILTDISCQRPGNDEYYLSLTIPVHIQLFNADGEMIVDETIYLQSIDAEEHETHSK